MLVEQIINLTKRINKRNRDKLVRRGQSDKVPSKELEKIRWLKLHLRNRATSLEDEIEKLTGYKKNRNKKDD